MPAILLYIFVSFAFIVLCVLVLWRRSGNREKSKWRRRCWTIGILLIPLIPYVVVELQTRFVGPSLASTVRSEATRTGLDEIAMMKVIRFRPGFAKVYIVGRSSIQPQCFSGETLEFVRSGHEWRFIGSWDTVWSDCGSADGNVFPPYAAEGEFR